MKKNDKIKTKEESVKAEVITLKFKVPESFKDPLDPNNSFEELEVEEFSHYYNIHLGVPVHNSEE